MKKKFIGLLALFGILICLASCSKTQTNCLEIDGKIISDGVFVYYLDRVLADKKTYGVKTDSEEDCISAAVSLCAQKVACKNIMDEESLVFEQQYKSEKAQQTENLWSLYSDYYQSIGITKPDITEITENEQMKNQLLEYYYGKNGKKPVSDDDLKQKFVEMYIGFKAFEGTFTKVNAKGETVEMTASEKEKLTEEFRAMANKVDSGTSIDTVYASYCKKQNLVATSSIEVTLTKDGDPMYADDFFEKVLTISHGRAAPVISGSSIYVVERCTIARNDDDAFEEYRSEVLSEMKMPAVEKKIAKTAEKLKIKKDESRLKEIYKTVYNEKAKNNGSEK
ncbi:MAG: hypothetical protein ACI4W6_08080 [Acutalibacteraceae bacterium]